MSKKLVGTYTLYTLHTKKWYQSTTNAMNWKINYFLNFFTDKKDVEEMLKQKKYLTVDIER